jgi:pyridoxamine 5'-phosphate oxidase
VSVPQRSDPFSLFVEWYAAAQTGPLMNSSIAALATATAAGRPSVRMVFFRGIREGGFSFFTNYGSRKGTELKSNPYAAMVFYWTHLGKQVRVEGGVARLSELESDSYFDSRERASQIMAIVSHQSSALASQDEFHAELYAMERWTAGKLIARPETWGGFKIVPDSIEFWLHREHRRHERLLFTKYGEAWKTTRLYP